MEGGSGASPQEAGQLGSSQGNCWLEPPRRVDKEALSQAREGKRRAGADRSSGLAKKTFLGDAEPGAGA